MDLAFNGNQRLMAGWEENTNGIKELSLWGIAANNELTYQTKQAAFTPEYDRVATGIVFQDGTSYLISTETAQYTGTVQAGDLGVLSAIDEDGILQWEVVLPPNGLLPKDILNYQDHLYLLANQYDMGGGNRGLQLFKYDLNGNQIWMRNYSGKSGQNISATELVLDQNGFTTVGNNVTFGPEIVQWDFNGSLLQFNTPLNTGYQLFGIARDAATGNLVAAGHNGTPGSQDAVVSHFGRQGTDYVYLQDYGYDDHGTEESFHDLILHSQGISAVGKVDNSDIGEGQAWDGLGVLFDAGGNVIQNQPAGGGTQDDYMNVIVKQSDEYAYVAGYNQVFTIDASGNAWQLGFRNYNSSGASTTLPRYIYLDEVITDGSPLTWDTKYNSPSKRISILNDLQKNNITLAFLYDIDRLFQSPADFTNIKPDLEDFIKDANDRGIRIGWVIGGDYDKIDFIFNKARGFNYSSPQNLHYWILEHEFWNAANYLSSAGRWQFPASLDRNGTVTKKTNTYLLECPNNTCPSPLPGSSTQNAKWNTFTETIKGDHVWLVEKMDEKKKDDCNYWRNLDYLRFNWVLKNENNFPGDAYPYNDPKSGEDDVTERDLFAQNMMKNLDMIWVAYYQSDQFSNGLDFDWNDSPNCYGWKEMLEDYNNHALSHPTRIAALLSAEIGFLGGYLGGSGDLTGAEDNWINGKTGSYNGYSDVYGQPNFDIDDVEIGGFAWFAYTFLEQELSSGNEPLTPFGQNGNYNPFRIGGEEPIVSINPVHEVSIEDGSLTTIKKSKTKDGIDVFPNPVKEKLVISSEKERIVSYKLYNITGELLKSEASNSERLLLNLNLQSPGTYLLTIELASGKVINEKVLVQ